MAATVGDILQFTDVQTYLNQQILNVYHFEVTVLGSAVDYQDMADAFQTQYVLEIQALQSNSLMHTSTIIKNLTNGLDIFEDPSSILGTDTATPGPSFAALQFRLLRATALTRHGAKRIGGLTEAIIDGNNINVAFTNPINDVATVMAAGVVVSASTDESFTLKPVIVGRYPAGDPNAGQLDLSKVNDVASAQFVRLTTQTTRRAGRGA